MLLSESIVFFIVFSLLSKLYFFKPNSNKKLTNFQQQNLLAWKHMMRMDIMRKITGTNKRKEREKKQTKNEKLFHTEHHIIAKCANFQILYKMFGYRGSVNDAAA